MKTLWFSFVLALITNTAFAHFVFILPASGNTPARVILSDSPTVDPLATAANLPLKAFYKVGNDGRVSEAPKPVLDKSTGVWSFGANDDLGAVIFGTIDYGVANRGEEERWLLRHNAKLVQDVSLAAKVPAQPLDISVRTTENGLVFVVSAKGNVLPNVDVFVHEPGDTKPKVVKTDAKGLTPAYSAAGQYAVRVFQTDNTPGEFEGRRYKSVKNYATLVVTKK